MRIRHAAFALVFVVACSGDGSATTTGAPAAPPETAAEPTSAFPPAPAYPSGPMSAEASRALDDLVAGAFAGPLDPADLDRVARAGDPRAAWVLADLMRFFQGGDSAAGLADAFERLTGGELTGPGVDFVTASNHLIAWDMPAWDGYRSLKRRIYTAVDDRWSRFFEEDHGVDWRLVTWGGVLADDRPFGDNGPCNCIPALDDPATTDASGGDWYGDEDVVFGVVVNDEAIALPRHQMEVHEMVNLTLGGRELGIPYCTLCASAQAYLTGDVEVTDRVVLRTSGLLSRSNKLMYDLATGSAIDTFTGEALTGPLAEAGVVLDQVSVVASTWGDWKAAHPDTRILAEDGGIGRSYADDPLGGRDDDGPIFPVGDVDPRLPVQARVLGVTTEDGGAVAFPVDEATLAIDAGEEVRFGELTVRLEGGLRVYDGQGDEVASHQAFWFAWSQFHPGTDVWRRG